MDAKAALIEANLRLVVSVAKRYVGPRARRSSTSSRRATSASSGRSRSSTTARATSSRPTPPGGSARPSPGPSPTRRARSACRCTWSRRSTGSPACSASCCRTSAASRPSRRSPQELEVTPERVREIQKIAQEPVSLETPVGEDEDSELGDFIEDQARSRARPTLVADAACGARSSRTILDQLTHRERKVLELRFGLRGEEPRTLEEVGQRFGVTRERIRQIEAKTLNKLQAYPRHPAPAGVPGLGRAAARRGRPARRRAAARRGPCGRRRRSARPEAELAGSSARAGGGRADPARSAAAGPQQRGPLGPDEQARQGQRAGAHASGAPAGGHVGAVGREAGGQGRPSGGALVVQVELHRVASSTLRGALAGRGSARGRGGRARPAGSSRSPRPRRPQLGLDPGRAVRSGLGVGGAGPRRRQTAGGASGAGGTSTAPSPAGGASVKTNSSGSPPSRSLTSQ